MTPRLPDNAALLLDLDGTLLDIAPTPSAVVVAPGLHAALLRVRDKLGGALAIVTGRPVEQVEALLPGAAHAVAGEHGGAIRHGPDRDLVRARLPDLPADWPDRAQAAADGHQGALLERKARGLVLHYRLAPAAGAALHEAMRAIAGGDPAWTILPAHMAWELKPNGVHKGTAVRALMAAPPFAGRTPVFIGDDVTDEDGMAAAREAGGLGWRVQEVFGDAAGVRSWLAAAAG